VVWLKAERRYGVLLGPAKRGGSRLGSSQMNQADFDARKLARRVAKVPQDQCDDYIRSARRQRQA
jgi:hypothetical protein